MQNFIIRITQKNFNIIENPQCRCFILPDTTSVEFAAEFVQKAHAADKLVLASGEKAVSFYQKNNLDGFMVDTSKESAPQKLIKKLQAQNPQAIIGVISRNRRHEAMLVSECEPDFVAFKVWQEGLEQTRELLQWYNELFLIQSAAQIEDNDVDISTISADFIIIDDVEVK